MKILIVIDHFESGGAARVVANLLDGFINKGYEVYLMIDNIDHKVLYPINEKVRIIPFKLYPCSGKLSRLKKYYYEIKQIRQSVKSISPDIVIGEMATFFLLSYIASLGLKTKVIAHDHTSFLRKSDKFENLIRYHLYSLADRLIILADRDKNILGKKFKNKCVIPNPLSFEPLKEFSDFKNREKHILCVGRFDVWHIKGFDRIIKCFSQIASECPEWKLVFAGTGSVRNVDHIKQLAEDYNISDSVVFLGQVEDIISVYRNSAIFALPSRIEGFPMSVLEAMSQGCACVVYDVGGVSSEMIIDGVSGFVINDEDDDKFKSRLLQMILEPDLRALLGYNAIKRSDKFSVSKVCDCWNDEFNKLISK